MKDYVALTKRFNIYTLVLIVLFFVLAIITPYSSVFFGLTLGSIVSLSHLWTTYFQVKRLGESIVRGRPKFSLGTLFRFSLAIGVVLVANQYPEKFHLISVIIGIMLTYIIILVHSLFQIKRL